MKVLINKSEINKLRSKSTEPVSQSIYKVQKEKVIFSSNYNKGLLLLNKIFTKTKKKEAIKLLKVFGRSLWNNIQKTARQKSQKESWNDRYLKHPKSSLDEHQTFESLEKELKLAIQREKQSSRKMKSWSKWGKLKKVKSVRRSSITNNEQVNIVKIAKPEPSKLFKGIRSIRKLSPVNTQPIILDLKGSQLSKIVPIKHTEEYKKNLHQICSALVYKYRYFLKLGFKNFLNNSKIIENTKIITIWNLMLKHKLRNQREAFSIWKSSERTTLLEKWTTLKQLDVMINNKKKSIAFDKWSN